LPGTTSVYDGDLAYYPSGNGGAGSIFLSDAPYSSAKDLYELTIPALKISNDVNQLNTATLLHSYDQNTSASGMVYRSTDNQLYYSSSATGAAAVHYRSINPDGTGESADRLGPTNQSGGTGMTQVPDDWAHSYASDKNIVTVGLTYGIHLTAVDPWNSSVTPTQLVYYSDAHKMNGYDSNDRFSGVTWISTAGGGDFVICGKDASAAAATFWFFHASDIAGAANTYSPQPYMTLSVQDKMLIRTQLDGVTYDPVSHVLYGVEGMYNSATVVHAWQVAPEPVTLALLALTLPAFLSRRR
jgi:hypothetical protein